MGKFTVSLGIDLHLRLSDSRDNPLFVVGGGNGVVSFLDEVIVEAGGKWRPSTSCPTVGQDRQSECGSSLLFFL